MQIVQLSGGLGNQLFQYAWYLQLNKQGYETFLDDESCYQSEKDRNNQLLQVGVKYHKASRENVLKLTDTDRHLKNWLRRRITGSNAVIRNEGDEICKDGYWVGYWQSAAFFHGIEEELRNSVFGPNFEDEGIDNELLSKIEESCSVSLHIRRGDYLNPDVLSVYGGICTKEYYDKAIEKMRDKYPNCTFFIFSNDPEWAKDTYTDEDMIVVCGNDEEHGYRDMYLMSKCKHHILANSSFSWWGAWLNPKGEKTVIAPSVWIHRDGFDGIYNGFSVMKIDSMGKEIS